MTAVDVLEIKDLLTDIKTLLESDTAAKRKAAKKSPAHVSSTPAVSTLDQTVMAYLRTVPSGSVIKASDLLGMYHTYVKAPDGSVPDTLKLTPTKFAKYVKQVATASRRSTGNHYIFP